MGVTCALFNRVKPSPPWDPSLRWGDELGESR